MNRQFLPGITKIAYCRADMLQADVLEMIDETKTMKVYGQFTEIHIVELGSMITNSELINGNTVYHVKISCKIYATDDEAKMLCKELAKNNHVFRCENIDGIKLLIGTGEKPYPTVVCTYSNEDITTGQRGWNIEINYSNLHSYIVLQ